MQYATKAIGCLQVRSGVEAGPALHDARYTHDTRDARGAVACQSHAEQGLGGSGQEFMRKS